MNDIPVAWSGAVTIALIVVLGILVYPALLRHAAGRIIVAITTVLLAVLFFVFDRSAGLSSQPAVAALVLALAPLLVGLIVHRLQRT